MSTATKLDPLESTTLEYAFRYRHAVAALFEQLPIFADAPRTAAEVLDALATEHGYLESTPLFGQKTCYKLTPRFSRDFDCDFDTSRPLKERDKTKSYAMLRFCLADKEVKRQALTAFDFEQDFPQLCTGSVAKNKPLFRNYYISASESRLGVLRVDSGGEGHWKRILTAAQREVQKHNNIPAYQELINSGQFELCVATMFESKAKRIRDELADQLLLHRVPLRVLAIPELLNLISPPPLNSL
jgi:hypothetical protein